MKIPAGATSFRDEARILAPGHFQGTTLRHTFRIHGSLDWLLIYTLGGSGWYHFPVDDYRTCPHQMTLYRPSVFQEYQIAPEAEKWDILFAHFMPKSDWMPWLQWPELAPGLMVLSVEEPAMRRRMVACLRDMLHYCDGSQPRGVAFGQNALEQFFLWCDSVNPRQASSQPDPRVRKAVDYLSEHAREPFDESRLARAAGLSPSRLRHLFRLQMGDSPRHFQEQLRLRRAQELLALSSQTIGEIAQQVGFENPFYFTIRFKEHTGESPRAYRQRITKR